MYISYKIPKNTMGASANSMQRIPVRHRGDKGQEYEVCVPFWGAAGDACCISYNLQPHCTDNRHIHAHIQKWKRAAFINIHDLTHMKSMRTILFEEEEMDLLPVSSLQNSELQLCNVIGLHKDLVTVQVFCQYSMKFIICSFNDKSCKFIFEKKYSIINKLQLYECYISPDENVMLLKQNQIYSRIYSTGSSVESISLVKLKWNYFTCEELSSTRLNEQVSSRHNTAVVFDPRTDNDLVVFTSETDDRGLMALYKTFKDTVLFKIIQFKRDLPALPGKFQNLQFMSDGSAIVLTVLGSENQPHSIASICRNQIVTVYWCHPDCFDKVGSFWYISPSSHLQYMPLISNSGRHACCGGKVYELHDMHPYQSHAMSLKRVCRDVILDTVLMEDLNKLPLPKPLLRYLHVCGPDINSNM